MTKIKTIFIHIGVWTLYWSLEVGLLIVGIRGEVSLVEPIVNLLYSTAYFYIALYFVFPRDPSNINYYKLSIRLAIVVVVAFIIKLGYTYFLSGLGLNTLYPLSNPTFFIGTSIHRFILFTTFAGFIWFFTTQMKMQKYVMEQEVEQQKLKNDLLKAEYDTLKAQINPHFLFNTLSFIYSKAVISSDELVSNTILLLSDVLRYSLQQTREGDKVKLNDEIQYIRKLYEINRLRFADKCYIDIQSWGEEHHQKIPPLILLTLFENAM